MVGDRRNFLRSMVGGIAAAAAVRTWPFRVYSFPSELKILNPIVGQTVYLTSAAQSEYFRIGDMVYLDDGRGLKVRDVENSRGQFVITGIKENIITVAPTKYEYEKATRSIRMVPRGGFAQVSANGDFLGLGRGSSWDRK